MAGCFIFPPSHQNSPYAQFMELPMRTFLRDFCAVMGVSEESGLMMASVVGASAVPAIRKMENVLKTAKTELSHWNQNELAVEVALPSFARYHSIFACPVSKQQSTFDNPPMMLPCGHVICKETVMKLAKGNIQLKFKCPYCPTESAPSQAIKVTF